MTALIKLHSLRAAKFKQLDDVGLAFPQKGSVLVQGLNEAGKSTLFESVFFGLFGKALVTEEPNRLDDLINYQSPRALVKLVFSTDGATFRVSRTLNRGKSNTAVLEIDYAGGKSETVTNLTAVNRRISEELGFDSEALLNSCFVEQKKLEKLESMTAQQRRDTLLRLLNLDRLTALEASYKPANADDYQLQQLRDRVKLAEIQRDLPSAVERLDAVDGELRTIAAMRLLHEIAALETSIAAEAATREQLRDEAERLNEALAEVDRLKAVRDLARAAGESLLSIAEDETDVQTFEAELAAVRNEAARLPALQAEQTRLEKLAAHLAELARREQAQAERKRDLARLAEALDRLARVQASLEERRQLLASLEAELAQARVEVEQADALERRTRQADLLRSWLQIQEVAHIAQESERELAALRQTVGGLETEVARYAADRHVNQRITFGLAAAALFVVALAGGLFGAGMRFGLGGLPLAAVLGVFCCRYALRARTCAAGMSAAESQAADIRVDVNRLEGEQSLAQRTGQDPARLNAIETELASFGRQPASIEEAHDLLAAIGPISAVEGASDLRQRLGELEGRRLALQAEAAELDGQLDETLHPKHSVLAAELAGEEQSLSEARAALDTTVATEAEARELAAAARAQRQAAEQAGRKTTEIEAALETRRDRLSQKCQQLAQTWAGLVQARPDLEQAVEPCRALWRETGEAIAKLDEPALRQASASATQSLAASQERVRAAERRIVEATALLPNIPSPAGAGEGWGEGPLDAREANLQAEQRELFGRVAALQDRKSAIERQLGLEGVAVDYAEAEAELAAFEERMEVRQQAYRIVTQARRNIVGKVLPSTIRNMGLLLPLLTNDRYRDVDIDPESYKIKVWDETARAMKAKDIFSGGTRDQFSLALRLAFALATLPEELGTAPGFIFLDEPLSSFDSIRSSALVNLLTRGPVAANFEQIVVISHSRAFDEQLFDYHLQLDGGRIVQSDLPPPPREETAPAQQPLALATAS